MHQINNIGCRIQNQCLRVHFVNIKIKRLNKECQPKEKERCIDLHVFQMLILGIDSMYFKCSFWECKDILFNF